MSRKYQIPCHDGMRHSALPSQRPIPDPADNKPREILAARPDRKSVSTRTAIGLTFPRHEHAGEMKADVRWPAAIKNSLRAVTGKDTIAGDVSDVSDLSCKGGHV